MRLKTQNYQQRNAMCDPETELSKYIARRGRGRGRATRKKWVNRKYMQKNHVAIILADIAMGDLSHNFQLEWWFSVDKKDEPHCLFAFLLKMSNFPQKIVSE